MPDRSPSLSSPLHVLVFSRASTWRSWLLQVMEGKGYSLAVEEVGTPREVFLRMVHQLPHLLMVDLDSGASELQQVLGFVERTCPFMPVVGLTDREHHDLSEWQREILPGRVARHQPEDLIEFLDWAHQLKSDGQNQARRMRIMQQIERNLRALDEMDAFFEEGSRLQSSFSQQTRQEIATSRRYLEALREQLRRQ